MGMGSEQDVRTCNECTLRPLSGGRQCDGALPTRTVGDMRGGTWAFGWLRRRMVAWFLALVDAAVEEPGTDVVAPRPSDPWTLPFHETTDWFSHATPHLLLLLLTPALDTFAHLTWSAVAPVAKRCTSVLATPQRPSTNVPVGNRFSSRLIAWTPRIAAPFFSTSSETCSTRLPSINPLPQVRNNALSISVGMFVCGCV